MISRVRRIPRKDFPPYNAPSFQWTGKTLRFRAIKGVGEPARFAIITAKKLYTTKASRNRAKRRISALLQSHEAQFDQVKARFVLVFPIIKTDMIDFASLKADFTEFLRELTK